MSEQEASYEVEPSAPLPTADTPPEQAARTMYADLCKHLPTYDKNRLSYLKQGQVIGRLNAVLGFDGWSFEIVEHGYRQDADELWVRGRLTVYGPRRTVVREQFGSQKHNRFSKDDHKIIDLGFDLKGAASDAMKKCCQAIGIGLWLASDEEASEPVPEKAPAAAAKQFVCEECGSLVDRGLINMGRCADCRSARPHPAPKALEPVREAPPAIVCEQCNATLVAIQFGDGTVWDEAKIAELSRRKYGRVLCMPHYKAAKLLQESAAPLTALDKPRPTQDARQKLGLPEEEQPAPVKPSAAAPIDQLATLRTHIRRTGYTEPAIAEQAGVERLEELSREEVAEIIRDLVNRPSVKPQPVA